MVELAIILLFLVLLVGGVIDLGRMMYEYLTMRDAAQESAGYGSIFPNYCEEIANRALQNMPDASYTVNVSVNGLPCADARTADATTRVNGCADKEIIINIDHNFSVSMPFLSTFTGSTVPMHVEIKDRIVRPVCK